MKFALLLLGAAFPLAAYASVPARGHARPAPELAERLQSVRARVVTLEQALVDGIRSRNEAKDRIRKIKQLMRLEKEEKALGAKRMVELASTLKELEARRETLNGRIGAQRAQVREFLLAIGKAPPTPELDPLLAPDRERLEAPRRRMLANLADRGVKEIEELKADVDDADRLKARIDDERGQLAYLFQDLKEQEGALELNRQIQVDLLKRGGRERLERLANYHRLKVSEANVEHMIGEFNARRELERTEAIEHAASLAMNRAVFAGLKGHLPLPVPGAVVSGYGRALDARSGLYVFKKGIDIAGGKNLPVRAVSAGRLAFSGELPEYGKVAIIDHGGHYYTLCAHLGRLERKTGDAVARGDEIAQTDASGTPVYFEVRARNVPVNPLQWISNSISLVEIH